MNINHLNNNLKIICKGYGSTEVILSEGWGGESFVERVNYQLIYYIVKWGKEQPKITNLAFTPQP